MVVYHCHFFYHLPHPYLPFKRNLFSIYPSKNFVPFRFGIAHSVCKWSKIYSYLRLISFLSQKTYTQILNNTQYCFCVLNIMFIFYIFLLPKLFFKSPLCRMPDKTSSFAPIYGIFMILYSCLIVIVLNNRSKQHLHSKCYFRLCVRMLH